MNKVKAIIFDLDGVIVSTDELHYRAWKMIADQEEIYFDRDINHRLRGVSRMESLDIILEKASKIYSPLEKQTLAEQKNNFYRELLKSLSKKDILDRVEETLIYLHLQKYKLAIGSSSKNATMILHQIGLYDCFDAIADGNDITRSKPFPDIFLKAAEKLHLNSSDCWVVEDAESGIMAAKAAKMQAVAIMTACNSPLADYKIHNLWELIQIL